MVQETLKKVDPRIYFMASRKNDPNQLEVGFTLRQSDLLDKTKEKEILRTIQDELKKMRRYFKNIPVDKKLTQKELKAKFPEHLS